MLKLSYDTLSLRVVLDFEVVEIVNSRFECVHIVLTNLFGVLLYDVNLLLDLKIF